MASDFNDQAAIISGATYLGQNSGVEGNSLDNKAFQYFQDAKLDILKKYDVYYSQYLSGADYFVNDSFNKYTDIKVEKKAGKYVVSCIVHYEDNTKLGIIKSAYAASGTNVYYPDTIYGKGVVYEKEYDMLPPIYLLYVPAVYNGAYCPVDNISVDTSGLAAGDKAKIYVFETAAEIDDKYKDIICKQFGVDDVEDLVYKNSKYTLNQKNCISKCEVGHFDCVLTKDFVHVIMQIIVNDERRWGGLFCAGRKTAARDCEGNQTDCHRYGYHADCDARGLCGSGSIHDRCSARRRLRRSRRPKRS